jgi:hypothetical protein
MAEDRTRPLPIVRTAEPRITANNVTASRELRVSPSDRFSRQANNVTAQLVQRLEPTNDPIAAFHSLGSYKRKTRMDLIQGSSMNSLTSIQDLAAEQNQVLEQIIRELKNK